MRAYTSIEQGNRLMELGVSPETCDMTWTTDMAGDFFPYPDLEFRPPIEYYNGVDNVPCWSVPALLNLLPKVIRRDCNNYPLYINVNPDNSYDIEYNANVIAEVGFNREDLIDAVYEMVVWWYENKNEYHIPNF